MSFSLETIDELQEKYHPSGEILNKSVENIMRKW